MQTQCDPQDNGWPKYYDSKGQPIFKEPSKIIPSTTIIIYEPFVKDLRLSWHILCHQRADNHLWGFVGGGQEIGESLLECAKREAKEETGLDIILERLVCVDSDPAHGAVFQYPDGNVIHYTNCTFIARIADPYATAPIMPCKESRAMAWWDIDMLPQPFSPLHFWRLTQALKPNQHPPVR